MGGSRVTFCVTYYVLRIAYTDVVIANLRRFEYDVTVRAKPMASLP